MFSAETPFVAETSSPEAFTSSRFSRSSALSEDQEEICIKHPVFLQFPQCTWSKSYLWLPVC